MPRSWPAMRLNRCTFACVRSDALGIASPYTPQGYIIDGNARPELSSHRQKPRSVAVIWSGSTASGCGGIVMMHAALHHRLTDQLAILLLGHADAEFLQKPDGRPDFIVAVVGPGRHARHLDAILDDPEQLGRCISVRRDG